METRHVHLFTSPLNPRDSKRRRKIHEQRDLAAGLEVVAAHHELGYRFGSLKLNWPPVLGKSDEILQIDLSDVKPGHRLITLTRPALSDRVQGDSKPIYPSRTSLELALDRIWWRYFSILSRSHIRTADALHQHFAPGKEDRRDLFVKQREGSTYKTVFACTGGRRRSWRGDSRTAAFLLVEPNFRKGGGDFVGLFTPDGVSTLAWAHLLRMRYREWLEVPGLTMVDLVTQPVPARPGDLSWALDWRAELVVQRHLPPSFGPVLARGQKQPPAKHA